VVDVRRREFFADLQEVLAQLRQSGVDYRILFLEASDDVLVRRYEQVRRPHPLQGEGRILDGISAERNLLSDIRERADVLIDSSETNVHELGRIVRAAVSSSEQEDALRVNVLSFGFKYGIPLDADHVVDVRFLPTRTGSRSCGTCPAGTRPCATTCSACPARQDFIDRYVDALEPVLAGYLREGSAT
jgi:UPF0042 nucleotide-binding protein